jgi:hypothetical protein
MLIILNRWPTFSPVEVLGEQFSLIAEPPHLDRARAKIELVNSAINMKVWKPAQRNRAGVQVTC